MYENKKNNEKITLELIRIQKINNLLYLKYNKLLDISKKYSKFVKRILQFPVRPAK